VHIYQLTRFPPPIASPNLLGSLSWSAAISSVDHELAVNLWVHSITIFWHIPNCCQHQYNVNRSGSNTQFSQTLRAISPVLLGTSRCSQTTLEVSDVLSDSARAFSGAPESTCSSGGAFRMLQDVTYRIIKFWSFWDLCADLRETSRAAETTVQLYGRHQSSRDCCAALCETWCRILTAVILTQPQGTLSLLQSQDSLHHNMGCIIYVSVYIYIRSIWLQMVVEHIWRSTWTRPLTELRNTPLGGYCGETTGRERREPTINNPAHFSCVATSKRNSWERVVLVQGA